MAYKLTVTEKAEADLDGILRYIAVELDNREAAAKLLDEIGERYALLERNPLLYALCDQPLLRRGGYRKVIVGRYLMICHVDEQRREVFIDRFFHDLQDYADKL